MTSSPDTSDFQGIETWLGSPLTPSGVLSIPVTGVLSAVEWVGSYESLLITWKGATNILELQLLWSTDPAGADFVNFSSYFITNGSFLQVTVPVLAPYVQFQFTNTGVSTQVTYFVATPSNVAATAITYLNNQNVINPGSVSYTNGTTTNYLIPQICSGWCHVHLSAPTVTGVLVAKLSTTNDGVNPVNEIYGHAYTGFLDDTVWIPAVPLLASVQNTDTVARSAVFYVNAGT